MDDLDSLLAYTDDIKSEINNLPFHEDDVRKIYLSFYYDLVYNLYIGKSMYMLSSYILNGKIIFSSESKDFDKHAPRLIKVTRFDTLTRSYYNNLNRRFFTDCFSNFEVCITIFCNALVNEEEGSNLLSHSFNEVMKILKSTSIDEETERKLSKLLIKNHLTHVPFVRKLDFLFKLCKKNYSGLIQDDREFLNFISKFRNTIHANWVYFGTDYEYFFNNGAHFIFENAKQVVWSNPYEDNGSMLLIDMSRYLNDIWRNLISGITHENLIEFYEADIG